MIKAVLFDTFGTIVDWRSSIARESAVLANAHEIVNFDGDRFARAWRELSQLWQNQRAQDAEIEALREEVEDQALPGEVDDLLKLFKRRAQLKRSAHRARWMSVALKSYRFIHVGVGQITFLALLVHILHALKVI